MSMLLLCKSCGWVEQPKPPVTAGSTAAKGFLAGIKAAWWMLGGLFTFFGYYIKILGGIMMAFGVATLIFLGLGFLFMAIAWVIMQIADVVLWIGWVIRSSAGEKTISQCPTCNSRDLIPTDTAIGRKLMADLGIEPPVESEGAVPAWKRYLIRAAGIAFGFLTVMFILSKIFPDKPPVPYRPEPVQEFAKTSPKPVAKKKPKNGGSTKAKDEVVPDSKTTATEATGQERGH